MTRKSFISTESFLRTAVCCCHVDGALSRIDSFSGFLAVPRPVCTGDPELPTLCKLLEISAEGMVRMQS